MRKIYLGFLLFISSCAEKEANTLNLENIEWIDLSYSFDSSTLY